MTKTHLEIIIHICDRWLSDGLMNGYLFPNRKSWWIWSESVERQWIINDRSLQTGVH